MLNNVSISFVKAKSNYIDLKMSQTIAEKEAEIIEDFDMFEEWDEKYQYIIDMGKSLESLPESEKKEENLVRGCQSRVWLTAAFENGIVTYKADSDAIITKGLVAILVNVLSGNTPEAITEASLQFVDKIGIREHLSPTRANGLNAMIKKMKAYALGLRDLK